MYWMLAAVLVAAVGAGVLAYVVFGGRGPDMTFPPGQTALDFTVKDIAGREVDLRRYKGQSVLMVNVASKCGFTPQYEQLNEVYKKYRERGFTVLGFPANDFMGQEPGTNAEIQSFCRLNYGVEFDLFSKVSVRGKDMAPLYVFLTSRKHNPEFGGAIKWNFTKFLLDREGKVVARFGPSTRPDAPEVIEAIERTI
jgi:glutathione peroxidase